MFRCLETTRGAEMNVKAVLIFRGHLSNQHQTTLIHNAKMVLKLFCHRLKICLDVMFPQDPLYLILNEQD